MIHYANKIYPQKPTVKNILMNILFVILIGAFFSIYLIWTIPVTDSLVFLILFIYMMFTNRGTIIGRILHIFVLGISWIGVVIFVEATYTMIFKISVDTALSNDMFRLGYIVSCNVIITLVTFLLYNLFSKRSLSVFSKPILATITLLMIVEFVLAEIAFVIEFTYDIQSPIMLLAGATIMILTILSVVVFEIMLSTASKKRIAELNLQTNSILKQYQVDMKIMYEKLLSSQHDLRKKMQIVEELLLEGNTVQNQQAIKSFFPTECKWECEYMTGNMIVDAILTAKSNVMQNNKIDFAFSPYPLHQLPIDEQSFCILLTNVLDNAIEGVLRIIDTDEIKRIELRFARTWDMFFLTCENNLNKSTIKRSGGSFISSKGDYLPHGLGIMSIKQIVKDNKGTCSIAYDEEKFSVKIMLPDKERKNAEADK